MEDYLIHYGVKGMKWGVRRQKKKAERGGLPSKRRIKKQMRKANKTPGNNKNTIKLDEKVNKELSKSKEYKSFSNYSYNMQQLQKMAQDRGGSLVLTRDQADTYNKLYSDAINKKHELAQKYVNEYASAYLKDLGYEDTKLGREYLIKSGLVNV